MKTLQDKNAGAEKMDALVFEVEQRKQGRAVISTKEFVARSLQTLVETDFRLTWSQAEPMHPDEFWLSAYLKTI